MGWEGADVSFRLDVARVALRNRDYRLALTVLVMPRGYALTAKRCEICGGFRDVRQRGWTDQGAPMQTCAKCGGPDDDGMGG